MKYLYYLAVLFTVILRRIIFPLVYVAIPFRGWLRNYVYNYHLQNGIILKRLYERNPQEVTGGYVLNNLHSPIKGFIKKRNVNKFMYYFIVLPLWLLLDDDSIADTYDAGFNKTIVNGERKKWMPKFIKSTLDKALENANACTVIGNSFDLGDKRQECELFDFWSVFWWTLRNSVYNFNYKFNQITKSELTFKIVLFNRLFGWDEDGMLGDTQTYSWEFGKLIKK